MLDGVKIEKKNFAENNYRHLRFENIFIDQAGKSKLLSDEE